MNTPIRCHSQWRTATTHAFFLSTLVTVLVAFSSAFGLSPGSLYPGFDSSETGGKWIRTIAVQSDDTHAGFEWSASESAAVAEVELLPQDAFYGERSSSLKLDSPEAPFELSPQNEATVALFGSYVPEPGRVRMVNWEDAVMESGGLVELPIERIGGAEGEVSVAFQTVDGTALAGEDYEAASGRIVFGDGVTDKVIRVLVVDNYVLDGDKYFEIELSDPVGTTIYDGAETSRIIIWDDEREGLIDPAFRLAPNMFAHSRAMVEMDDGNILVGGSVNRDGERLSHLALFGPDGSINPDFEDKGFTERNAVLLHAMVRQDDGKILVGGRFSEYDGEPRRNLVRLHPDGRLDGSFDLRQLDPALGEVDVLALQGDGRILVGGNSSSATLVRLHPDGSRDWSFRLSEPMTDRIGSIKVAPNGKIYVAGYFTSINGEPRPHVARLHPDGSLDEEFVPEHGFRTGRAMAIQPDGKLLLSGYPLVDGRRILRLNQDGSRDETFDADIPQWVRTIVLQPDGKILVGGGSAVHGTERGRRLARLLPDGSLDESFNADNLVLQYSVDSLILREDGRLVVGGLFTNEVQPDVRGLMRIQAMVPVGGKGEIVTGTDSIQVLESAGMVRVTVSRTNGGTEALSVDFFTEDGTAVAGVDYEAVTGTLVFGEGELVGYIEVPLIDNTIDDGTRRFAVTLVGAAVPGGEALIEVEILDDDYAYMIPEAPAVSVWESADEATVKVWGLPISGGGGSVRFETVDGTARAGEHFEYKSGVIEFGRGDGPVEISIPVISNNIVNPDRSFRLRFFEPEQGVFREALSEVEVILLDDDLPGRLDVNFAVHNVDGRVTGIAPSADGSGLLVGGYFWTFNGEAYASYVQLLPNGELDPEFPGIEALSWDGYNWRDADIRKVLPLSNGKTLIAGRINRVNGATVSDIARLLRDGSLDPTFNSGPARPFSAGINDMLEMPDGTILVVGGFTTYKHQPRHQIVRLHPNGDLDTTFVPYHGEDAQFSALRKGFDGTVFAAGKVSLPSGAVIDGILRLKENGEVDPDFMGTSNSSLAWTVRDFAPLPDGRVIAVGGFRDQDGDWHNVVRLDVDGRIDPSFSTPEFDFGDVSSVAVQPDGKIWIGGRYERILDEEGKSLPNSGQLVRLLQDGSPDPEFENGLRHESHVQTAVRSLLMLDDGNLLVGGRFEQYGGYAVSSMMKISAMAAYPGAGSLDFPYARFNVQEDAGSIRIPVIRSDGGSVPVTVAYSTSDDSALADADYLQVSGELEFQVGEVVRYIEIPILENADSEAIRSFSVQLHDPTQRAVLGERDETVVVIRGNRDRGSYLMVHPEIVVPNLAHSVEVEVVRVGGSRGSAVLNYSTVDGTALAGRDYHSTQGSLSFEDGETTGVISVSILSADEPIGGRSFSIQLQGNRSAELYPHQTSTTVIIEDSRRGGIWDTSFRPTDSDTKSTVSNLIPLPGGDLLASGSIGSLSQPREDVARFKADGSRSNAFPNRVDAYAYGMDVQPDGAILLGRQQGNGVPGVIRLSEDGSVDRRVNIELDPQRKVNVIRVLPDGKFLVAGDFRQINGQVRRSVARFHLNGSYDHSFAPPGLWKPDAVISDMLVQPDGKIVLAGEFEYTEGWTFRNLMRLNPDGTVDPSFNPPAPNGSVTRLMLQPDGAIIIGGAFNRVGSHHSRRLARLLPGGAFDSSFNVGSGADDTVLSLLVQPDGRILVGGRFDKFNNHDRPGLVRLERNGAVDLTFHPDFDANSSATIEAMTLADRNSFYVTGAFVLEGGRHVNSGFARLFFGQMEPLADTVSFGSRVYNESLDAESVSVWIVRKGNAADSLEVSYRTDPGSAKAGIDYEHSEGTVVFSQGESARKITIPLLPGTPAHGSRAFYVSIFPDGETESLMTTVQLRDNGEKGYLRFTGPVRRVSGRADVVDIDILRTGGFSGVASVEAYTTEGSAKAGIDFESVTKRVEFEGDDRVATVRVPLLRPARAQGTRSFQIGLRFATEAGLLRSVRSRNVVIHYEDSPGTLDVDFDPVTLDGNFTRGLVRLKGGDLLVSRAGDFPSSRHWPWQVVRLTPNGALTEEPFLPLLLDGFAREIGLQGDGQVYLGGNFNRVGNLSVDGEVLLDSDLMPNHLFTFDYPESFGGYWPGVLAYQPDGRVIEVQWNVRRLLPDGSLDDSFVITEEVRRQLPGMAFGCALVQPDGKIVLGGAPTFMSASIIRLHPDGSIDSSFDPGEGSDLTIYAMVMQPDGRIIIGGDFAEYDGRKVDGIARIYPDGSLDESFASGVDGSVGHLLLLPDGKFLAGGVFQRAGGLHRAGLARFLGDESSIPAVVKFEQSAISIQRSAESINVTIRRSGNLGFRSLVAYGTQPGDAQPGVDFEEVYGTLQFEPGDESRSISIPVLDNDHYRGARSFRVTLGSPTGGTLLGEPASLKITLLEQEEAPIERWRRARFGEEELDDVEISGIYADPYGQGVPNLMRYAFGAEKTQNGREVLPHVFRDTYSGLDFLMISYRVPEGRDDVHYIVEVADDFPEFWWPIDQSKNLHKVDIDEDGTTVITIRDNVPIRDAQQRFMRLRLNHR